MNIKVRNCGNCPCCNHEESTTVCNISSEYIPDDEKILETCPLNNAQDNYITITKE